MRPHLQAHLGGSDLVLLPLLRDVLSLVVSTEQQDQPVAVGVTEEAVLDSLALESFARRLLPATSAGGIDPRLGVAVEAKLEDAVAELAPKARTAHAGSIGLEDLQYGSSDKLTGLVRQFLGQPAMHRSIASGVLVPLDLEPGRHESSQSARLLPEPAAAAKTAEQGMR